MKKILFIITNLFIVPFFIFSQMKNNTNLELSVTPLDKDEKDNVQFGGSYLRFESLLSDDYVTLGGKLYYRIKETDSKETVSQKLDVKRAYAKIRPFGNESLEIAMGKLYSYYLSGGYFSLTETYTGAARWGESGVGLKSSFNGFTLGLALPVTESYVEFKKNWGLNASLSYDFSHSLKELPLTIGANLLYSATADDNENVFAVSEKDFSECFALNVSNLNLPGLKKFPVFFAFSHNVRPYVAHTVLSPVEVVKSSKSDLYKDVKRSNLFSLAFRPVIGSLKITSETEIGHSVKGSVIPFYSALQFLFPVYGNISLKPMAGYYAAFNTSDSSKSYDTWEFYPRIVLEVEKWTFTAGWDMFNKKFKDSERYWVWTLPVTAKLKVGGR